MKALNNLVIIFWIHFHSKFTENIVADKKFLELYILFSFLISADKLVAAVILSVSFWAQDYTRIKTEKNSIMCPKLVPSVSFQSEPETHL